MIKKTPVLPKGMKVRVAVDRSEFSPRTLVLDGFLTAEECTTLIDMAKTQGMFPSPVYSDSGLSDDRSSESCYFSNDYDDPLIQKIFARYAKLLNCPVSRLEEIGVVLYPKGGIYDYHFDTDEEMLTEPGGSRLSTCVVYLNNVEKGGATKIFTSGVSVIPNPGSMLYFENVHKGVDEKTSLHSGETILKGEKWILTMWERERNHKA